MPVLMYGSETGMEGEGERSRIRAVQMDNRVMKGVEEKIDEGVL